MCCPFQAILNPSSVKCILKMRSQCPHSEKVCHRLKGKYFFFFSNVLVAGQRVYNTHKKTHYIDHHKTIKLAGKSISVYISIVSQVALNKIQEPHSEWRWPRNIRNKFQKVENMSKTKKSTSYTSFTKLTYNWISRKKFSGFFHDAKVSMQLFTKPQKISTGHRSLSLSL